MLIVYRKADHVIASNSGTNSFLPQGPPLDWEVQNAIKKLGGVVADYAEYRLDDEQDAVPVREIMNAGSYELAFDAQGNPTGVVTYAGLTASATPNPVAINATVTVSATLPAGTPDISLTFQVEGGAAYTEPVSAGQASHAYAFVTPGTYRVVVSSLHHGTQVVEVVVQ